MTSKGFDYLKSNKIVNRWIHAKALSISTSGCKKTTCFWMYYYPNNPRTTLGDYTIQSLGFRVGGLIIMTNSPRKQKKNKVNVCSILVNK